MNKIVVMEDEAFRMLSSELKLIKEELKTMRTNTTQPLKDRWLDNQDVMQLLKASKRTLQTLRDRGSLPFSKVGNKLYYKAADVQRLLEENFNEGMHPNHLKSTFY